MHCIRSRYPIAPLLLAITACTLSPLSRKIKVGEEPMVVFVATAHSGWTDLFAVKPDGGEPTQITFTRLRESLPRLTSQGDVIAFMRDRGDSPGEDLVVMNLLNGAERLLELPPEAGSVETLGWSWDDTHVNVATATGRWRVAAPPAALTVQLLDSVGAALADSTMAVLLGNPRFARAEPCDSGGLCITGRSGTTSRLSATGVAPFRWGSDSVGWIEDGEIVVRPLGPGAVRRIELRGNVTGIREAAYAQP